MVIEGGKKKSIEVFIIKKSETIQGKDLKGLLIKLIVLAWDLKRVFWYQVSEIVVETVVYVNIAYCDVLLLCLWPYQHPTSKWYYLIVLICSEKEADVKKLITCWENSF